MKVKECLVKIAKSDNDTRETIFVSHNLKALSVEVGKEIWVEEPYYKILSSGNLGDRTSLLKERVVEK